jgi:hypothetical protein
MMHRAEGANPKQKEESRKQKSRSFFTKAERRK